MMIGDRIKEARLALGYSAEQVAAFLNVSPATVYRYENGDISKLPSKFIKPLADFLCITPAYLMGWSDEKTVLPKNNNDRMTELQNSLGLLMDDEAHLIISYRSLSPRGKDLLNDRAEELKLLYGKKSEDSSAESI